MKLANALFPTLALASMSLVARAQVGVGTATPDAKSALDIRATDKGLLIPRLTAAQRTGISSPPQGLMVYQTDGTASGGTQTGFWYYAGTGGWVFLDAGGGGGLTLPYSGSYSGLTNAFGITNTGIGAGIVATTTLSTAVSGTNTGGGAGLSGTSGTGTGVAAASTSGVALTATKTGTQTGRAASFTNTNAANDSTAAYISTNGDRPALRAVNTATSAQAAIRGVKQSASTDGIGVEGIITSGATGNAAGVLGNDQSGSGGGSGVIGLTAGGYGVRGIATASGGYGVSGQATDSYGVIGNSSSGIGAQGSSTSNSGVVGITSAGNSGVAGVKGSSTNSSGIGVLGLTSSGYGVRGEATGSNGYGVGGTASAANGIGVIGTVTGTSLAGVFGSAVSGYGVGGTSTNGAGVNGVSTNNVGVNGSSTTSSGVVGTTAASGTGFIAGVKGISTASGGYGVYGAAPSGIGVRGETTGNNGAGVLGVAFGPGSSGVFGSATGPATAVYGSAGSQGRAGWFTQTSGASTADVFEVQNDGLGRAAIFRQTNTVTGAPTVEIVSSGGITSAGSPSFALALDAPDYGLKIYDSSQPAGPRLIAGPSFLSINGGTSALPLLVGASTPNQFGVSRSATFQSRVTIEENLQVFGSLSKGGGSFKIDHPLDPENQYLYHSFVESPDMLNVYNGNVVLDTKGEATVTLPDYFEALNRDFRYQLTPIGAAFTPYVKEKVAGNKFQIAGQPGAEVSWQVTGIRHDKWADANRIPNTVPKEPENRGKFLHPKVFGLPAAQGIGYPSAEAAPKAARPTATTH